MKRYWVFVDTHDGNGFQKQRQQHPKTKTWGYSCTWWQKEKARRVAQANGWDFRSCVVPKEKSKPSKQDRKEYPNATHVTPNFTWKEFACKDGTPVPAHLRSRVVTLCWGLEKMRKNVGAPIGVLSGYRTESYNRAIGGATLSQHVQARAADLVVAPHGQRKLVEAAEQVDVFYNGGIGVYPSGGVHVDVRGYKARWSSF